jgi:twitching motility protein PilU
MSLDRLFRLMAEKDASDLFLSVGSPVTIKINGVCVPINQERLQPQAVVSLLADRVTDAQFRALEESCELNIGLPVQGIGSFRLSAFMQRGSVSAVIRYIPHEVPRLEELLLPDILKSLVMEKRGLILVVGAAGSGKSTTIA